MTVTQQWLQSAPVVDAVDRGFDACGTDADGRDLYALFLSRLQREHVPYSITWELTHACNLHCVMCYNVPRHQPELSTAECLDLLGQMAQAGTLRLTLTGGEILTRRDFFTIAEHARTLGFALYLKTNASLLTPATADRMAALDPVQVDISLLGASNETFDAVAGSHNTLTRVLRGVQLLQARGVRVKLNTLLLDLNVAERQQMLDLATELGVRYEQVIKISQNDDGTPLAMEHQLTRNQMTQVLLADGGTFVPQPPAPSSRTCKVGLAACVISPYGEVFPCIELRISAGNVREQPFGEIWRHAPIFRNLRQRHTYANLPECQVCPINAYCEGRCAGLAWKESGDLFAGNTLACAQAQARFAQVYPGMPVPQTPLQAKQAALGGSPVERGPVRQSIPLLNLA
jgi:radical SAM protein with 4Fe4S-binding SPASM domain